MLGYKNFLKTLVNVRYKNGFNGTIYSIELRIDIKKKTTLALFFILIKYLFN